MFYAGLNVLMKADVDFRHDYFGDDHSFEILVSGKLPCHVRGPCQQLKIESILISPLRRLVDCCFCRHMTIYLYKEYVEALEERSSITILL